MMKYWIAKYLKWYCSQLLNAVYHGLERRMAGTLVYGKIDNAEIIFIVQDDGIGIQSYELERLNSIIKECNDSENLFKDKKALDLLTLIQE